MEKLISSRCDLQHLPASYVLPPESRPRKKEFVLCEIIPVIDLRQDRAENVRQVLKAGQEFGFFQLTNHGVSKKLMSDVLEAAEEFFRLPNGGQGEHLALETQRAAAGCTRASTMIKRRCTTGETVCDILWTNTLDEHVQCWPEKPARYRYPSGCISVYCRHTFMAKHSDVEIQYTF